MQTINNTWKKFGNEERIRNPKEIEDFLNSLIQDTEFSTSSCKDTL